LCFPPHMLSRSSFHIFLNQHSAYPLRHIPSTPGVLLCGPRSACRLRSGSPWPVPFRAAPRVRFSGFPIASAPSSRMLFAFRAISLQAVLVSKIIPLSAHRPPSSDLRLFALPLARYPGLCRLPAIRCCCSPFRITPTWPRLLDLPGTHTLFLSIHPLIHRKRFPHSLWALACIGALPSFTADGIPVRQAEFCLHLSPIPPRDGHLWRSAMPSRYRAGSGLSPVRLRPCRAVG
jgi:hypothetical protein